MSVLFSIIATLVVLVWSLGFVMTYFVDLSYADAAHDATPVMIIVVTGMFGPGALELWRGIRKGGKR